MPKLKTKTLTCLVCVFMLSITSYGYNAHTISTKNKETKTIVVPQKIVTKEVILNARLSSFNINEQKIVLMKNIATIEPEMKIAIDAEIEGLKLKVKQKEAEDKQKEIEAKKREIEAKQKALEARQQELKDKIAALEAKQASELPVNTTALGKMKIVSSTNMKNSSGKINYDNMSITINPNIVPYGTIVWIEGLGFRYNHPSDMGSDDNVVHVYFKSQNEANNWDNKKARIYIVQNSGRLDISKNSLVNFENLSTFKLTSYCPCPICCGEYSKPYADKAGSIGTYIYEGVTVAADPSVIPYGSVIYIEGVGIRFVADCGGGINDKHIDVYWRNHQTALDFGTKSENVYLIKQ